MTRNRAYLLPALFILVGVLALLVNVGAIPTDRLYRLADLWPVLVIILGLELVVNRARFPAAVETTASVLIVAVALVGAAVYVAVGTPISSATQRMTASAPLGALTRATLEIDAGESTLDVEGSTTGLVNDLFQAQITYSGPKPTVTVDPGSGRVVIKQEGRFGFFGAESFNLSVQLNVAIPWAFAIHTGSSKATLVLPQMLSMELDTGASTIDMSLPVPAGIVPVRINGGALTVHMHRPTGAGASVKLSGGAVTLNFDGDQSKAVGSLSHATGSDTDMFDVRVNGGTCNVTMDTGLG